MTQWPSPVDCPGLSDHQRSELTRAFAGPLGILAGRPGTGKTFVLAAVIRALGGRRIAVAAPTGKAAVRVTESLQAIGIDLQATTMHRLLGVEPVGGGWEFTHNEENHLPFDFLFVDEFSMCDVPLAASLLAARPASCHVLLVGDPGQLSPVGHGAPLRDLMAAGVPSGTLTEIRRNSGRIVEACKDIAEKHTFTPSLILDLAAGENLVWIERARPEQQIVELRNFLERLRCGDKYDPVWDCQVIVPVNEKSPLARKVLNRNLQGFLNPDGEQAKGNPFRVGDKIICISNGFARTDKDWRATIGRTVAQDAIYTYYATATGQVGITRDGKTRVANGELGQVRSVSPKWFTVFLQCPDRLLIIPRGAGNEETGDTGCNWELAYGITVHKSQGSEWPIVVVMVDSYPGAVRLVDRHWIYTALSRGKEFMVGIGQLSLARQACQKSHMRLRKTFLVESIEELRTESLCRAWDNELERV